MHTSIPSAADVRAKLEGLSHGQTQRLAVASGVPFTTLWKIRSGETENPRLETVGRFFPLLEAELATPTPEGASHV